MDAKNGPHYRYPPWKDCGYEGDDENSRGIDPKTLNPKP